MLEQYLIKIFRKWELCKLIYFQHTIVKAYVQKNQFSHYTTEETQVHIEPMLENNESKNYVGITQATDLRRPLYQGYLISHISYRQEYFAN